MAPDLEVAGDRPATEPTDEIEITPAMLAAGTAELRKFDRRYESYEQGATAIFEAMIEALRNSRGRIMRDPCPSQPS
jgi:hypothetical protein